MKSIKKITKTVAGSALLVGATLAGASAMGAAQSGSSGNTLGDYPAPFVDEDGTVDGTTVVVGDSAKTADVLGATNIAAGLGNAAFTTETKSVSGSGAGASWSATDGQTLDTRNDNLYFGDDINTVRETLTEDHLSALSEVTFEDDGGDDTDIEFYLYPGTQSVDFAQDDADNEDPRLLVNNPDNPSSGNNLFKLQANFEDGLDFTDSEVQGEDIELFGQTYTVSEDSDASELVLYGSQDEFSLNKGESTTISINGNEHEIEVVSVEGDTAAFRVDGALEEEDESGTVTIDGQDVRLSQIVDTGDNGKGVVEFSIGSQTLSLSNGDVEDSEGDDIDGVSYAITGANFTDVSSMEFYVGAQDDDRTYVAADETYSHPMFDNIQFAFGGLAPNTAEGGDNVAEISFQGKGDEDATASFTSEGESVTMNFIHGTSDPGMLADADNDTIHTVEGAEVAEDEYISTDAGDFAHMWEVTSIDLEGEGADKGTATVDLTDAVTGDSVELEVDERDAADNSTDYYEGEEIIDGQTYHVQVKEGSPNTVQLTYGDAADLADVGDTTSVYTPVDLKSGSALAFTEKVSVNNSKMVELPSTESTDAKTYDLSGLTVASGDNETIEVGQTKYVVTNSSADGMYEIGPDAGQDAATGSNNGNADFADPSALVVQPEDDDDEENAFLVAPSGYDSDDGYAFSGSGAVDYSGASLNLQTLEGSDDDLQASYVEYGTYVEQDTDSPGSLSLMVPEGQSTAGAAFTGAGGSLSAQAGGAGSVQSMMPTYNGNGFPASDFVALDNENPSQLKQNDLILVGGPAVNNLVSELAEANKTTSDYSEGDQRIELVNDAFTEGQDALVVAGYAAEDTRAAARSVANWGAWDDSVSGQTSVNLATQ